MKIWVLSALFLAGCHHLKEGEVADMWHEPSTTYVMLIPMSTGKTTILIPYVVYDNEDWVVRIKGEYKGKIRTESYYVSETDYRCLAVGSHFVKGKDCYTSDQNNSKQRQ